jgi:hypothetical protein
VITHGVAAARGTKTSNRWMVQVTENVTLIITTIKESNVTESCAMVDLPPSGSYELSLIGARGIVFTLVFGILIQKRN